MNIQEVIERIAQGQELPNTEKIIEVTIPSNLASASSLKPLHKPWENVETTETVE